MRKQRRLRAEERGGIGWLVMASIGVLCFLVAGSLPVVTHNSSAGFSPAVRIYPTGGGTTYDQHTNTLCRSSWEPETDQVYVQGTAEINYAWNSMAAGTNECQSLSGMEMLSGDLGVVSAGYTCSLGTCNTAAGTGNGSVFLSEGEMSKSFNSPGSGEFYVNATILALEAEASASVNCGNQGWSASGAGALYYYVDVFSNTTNEYSLDDLLASVSVSPCAYGTAYTPADFVFGAQTQDAQQNVSVMFDSSSLTSYSVEVGFYCTGDGAKSGSGSGGGVTTYGVGGCTIGEQGFLEVSSFSYSS